MNNQEKNIVALITKYKNELAEMSELLNYYKFEVKEAQERKDKDAKELFSISITEKRIYSLKSEIFILQEVVGDLKKLIPVQK